MKILLADDEPIARTMLEHWLAGWGYGICRCMVCARVYEDEWAGCKWREIGRAHV